MLHPQLPQYATSIITFYFTEESAQPIVGCIINKNIMYLLIIVIKYYIFKLDNIKLKFALKTYKNCLLA
jgi:hypothetical protein